MMLGGIGGDEIEDCPMPGSEPGNWMDGLANDLGGKGRIVAPDLGRAADNGIGGLEGVDHGRSSIFCRIDPVAKQATEISAAVQARSSDEAAKIASIVQARAIRPIRYQEVDFMLAPPKVDAPWPRAA